MKPQYKTNICTNETDRHTHNNNSGKLQLSHNDKNK